MKRIFYFLMATLMMISVMANAQTVKNDGVFSHMNIGVKGGAAYSNIGTIKNFSFNSLDYNAALEIGKDVTPITGFSLEGIVTPKFENGFSINRTDLFGNVKFNLMNLFGGYKGYPRRVEIRTVTGIGWNHNFNPGNPNDIALQGGLEFDFNLGKNRNWYITFTPMLQANEIARGGEIQKIVKDADLKANIGVAYRLGRGNKSHNFTICPYKYTDEQYAELYNKYDECMNKPTVIDTVVVEKVVEKVIEKVIEKPSNTVIAFEIGSSKISKGGIKTIENFANTVKETKYTVKVIGSADSKTGSKKFNEKLAWSRAENVAKELIKYGVDECTTEITIDLNGANDSSRCAVIVAE